MSVQATNWRIHNSCQCLARGMYQLAPSLKRPRLCKFRMSGGYICLVELVFTRQEISEGDPDYAIKNNLRENFTTFTPCLSLTSSNTVHHTLKSPWRPSSVAHFPDPQQLSLLRSVLLVPTPLPSCAEDLQLPQRSNRDYD